jgi:hypothetical protein
MRAPFGWLVPAVAAAATGVAVWAGSNLAVALPSATVAIAAAALLFVEVWLRSPPSGRRVAPSAPRGEPVELREAFRSGRLGREKLVLALDQLERAGPNPNLPGRRSEEIREFGRMSAAEFRAYVRRRLDELEERT